MKLSNRSKIIALCAALVTASAIGFGVSASNAAENNASKYSKNKIGIDRANELALEVIPGLIQSVELENEDGKIYYDFEIVKDSKEYDVHIDAYTGQTLKVKIDDDRQLEKQQAADQSAPTATVKPAEGQSSGTVQAPVSTTPPATVQPSSKPTSQSTAKPESTSKPSKKSKKHSKKKMLNIKKALQLAEKHIDGKVYSIELDEEDGVQIYEVELMTSRGEVEIDIDAYTGELLNVEYDNYKAKQDKDDDKHKNKHDKDDDDNDDHDD